MITIYEYLATCIDLEGSISLGKRRKDIKYSYSYAPNVAIDNLSKALLEHIRQKMNFGRITKGRILDNGTQMWRWILSINEIRRHLSFIEPYLIIKQEQAQLLIIACQILKSKNEYDKMLHKVKIGELYTETEYFKIDEIYQKLKILNGKSSTKVDPLTDAEKLYRELRRK